MLEELLADPGLVVYILVLRDHYEHKNPFTSFENKKNKSITMV